MGILLKHCLIGEWLARQNALGMPLRALMPLPKT